MTQKTKTNYLIFLWDVRKKGEMSGFILLKYCIILGVGMGVLFLKERVESLDWLSTRRLAQATHGQDPPKRGRRHDHSVCSSLNPVICHLFAIYV